MKHTPGPWNLGAKRSGGGLPIAIDIWSNAPMKGIAVVQECRTHGMSSEELLANARLVAAAPEILTALKSILAGIMDCDDPYGYPGVLEAEKAIAKVESPK